MEPRPNEYPKEIRTRLLGYVDAVLPDCFWKRRFLLLWQNLGLDTGWAAWKAEAPIMNPEFLPLCESTIQELQQWRFS